MPPQDLTIQPGQTPTIIIYIPTSTLSSGTTIEIKLHTAEGMDYPVMVNLP